MKHENYVTQEIRYITVGEPGCYWDIDRSAVDNKYRDAKLPFLVERKNFPTLVQMKVQDFTNYLRTYSGYRSYLLQHPEASDPLVALEKEMASYLESQGLETMEVDIPHFTIMHKKVRAQWQR